MASTLVWTDQECHIISLASLCRVWPGLAWVLSLWAVRSLIFPLPSWLHPCQVRCFAWRCTVGWGWPARRPSAASTHRLLRPLFRSSGSLGFPFPPPPPSPAPCLLLLLLFSFLRIGEARVPGPHLADTHLDEDLIWLISANSTGIAHKSSMILQPGVTWLIQESHLTVRGLDHFRKELKATTRIQASSSRIHSLAGHPVEPRRPGLWLVNMPESSPLVRTP